jgi:hypothetical protein
MDIFLKYINCCKKEDLIKNQTNCEINVPLDNTDQNNYNNSQNISLLPDKPESNKYMDASIVKTTEANNTFKTLNENNNINNNNINNNTNANNNTIRNTTEEIVNNSSSNKNNNKLIINNNIINTQNETRTINKVDTFEIQSQQDFLFCNKKKNLQYSNIIPDIQSNNNKVLNNISNNDNINNSNTNNSNNLNINNSNTVVHQESRKNLSSSVIINNTTNKIIKDSNSRGTILTLNDLVLNNQTQEICAMGSKLLLSGELFFWKEIIMQTNGIKNSLRKEKDDHVFFGIKNKVNYAGAMYNDLIINYFWHEEDMEVIETNTGRVFEIYYNKKTKDYTLRFLHPALILYYKINNFVYFNIGKEYSILLGSVFMTIIVKKTSPLEKTINIKIETGNNNPIKYTFNQNQTPIKIGRINKSEIPIFNSSISKRHGIIEYSKNSQSYYYKDMGSTNSSTLIIREGDSLKIKGEMNFKLEDVPFKIQEIP